MPVRYPASSRTRRSGSSGTGYTDNVAESAGITLNASSDFSSLEIPALNANTMALVNDNSSSLGSKLDKYTSDREADLPKTAASMLRTDVIKIHANALRH